MVKKGEALVTIYSPDLLATEQELLEMLRTSGSSDGLSSRPSGASSSGTSAMRTSINS